jgi:hypothetical protein
MAGAMALEREAKMAETFLAPDGKRYDSEVEHTPQGLQLMLGGVRPQTMKDKVDWFLTQPMQPRKRQKPCDVDLFDTESRKQMELFGRLSDK